MTKNHHCSSAMLQFEGNEPLTNSILGQRQRPTSDINNSASISPAHPKVTRSISANQKQRRYSDHGGDDDGGGGGGGVIEKPSKVTSYIPALRVLRTACCVGGCVLCYPESLMAWWSVRTCNFEMDRRGHSNSLKISKCNNFLRFKYQTQIIKRQKSQQIGCKHFLIGVLDA